MAMTLSQQLEEIMEFGSARILRVRQSDSDLYIATYQVGGEYWMTLTVSSSEEDYSSVYLTGDGLNVLKETLDALPINALNTENEKLKRGVTLQADYEAMQHELERYKSACNEWLEKSEWVQETAVPKELGMHRADVMKRRVEALQTECEKLRKDAERYQWLRDGNNEENSEATIIAANFWGDRWDHMIDNAMEPHTANKEVRREQDNQ